MSGETLVITGIYPPESGGPAKFAKEFSSWLSSHDMKTTVLCYSDLGIDDEDIFEVKVVSRKGSNIHRIIRFTSLINRNTNANVNVLAVGAFIEVYIASLLKKFRYTAKVPGDIVWERARNFGYTKLGIEEFQDASLSIKYRLFRHVYSLSLKRAQRVIVPSIGLRNLCLKWGVDPLKIKVVYNSIDTNFFAPKKVKEPTFEIITACRLTTWKRVDELITLTANMGIRLAIAGDGPEKANLEAWCHNLKADVVFFGDLSKEELLNLFHSSCFFVLNSEYEGLPHVLVEARSSGVLVLARSGTGSSEVIHDKRDGFLYSNVDELREKITFLRTNPKNIQAMRNLAREDALLRFNKDQNFYEILEVMRDAP